MVDNNPYVHVDGQNPKHAVAFKEDDDTEARETTVEFIDWKSSKNGKSKPVLNVKKVKVMQSDVVHITASNAKWVMKNKVGPGSRISVVLAGTIIPKVHAVLGPSTSGEAELPEKWAWWKKPTYLLHSKENYLELCKIFVQSFVGSASLYHHLNPPKYFLCNPMKFQYDLKNHNHSKQTLLIFYH